MGILAQFLKGLGVAIIGLTVSFFFLWGAIGTQWTSDADTLWQEVPVLMGLSFFGLIIMFIGPIYFWIIGPILKKLKER